MPLRLCGLIIFISFISLACDQGLEPPPPAPSIAGRIRYAGITPPCDSIRILAVVLVETAPPYVPTDLINGFLNNTILTYVLEPCTFRDTTYQITVIPGKRYNYLGVAQNYDTNLYNDWRVVGFSHLANDSARSFELSAGEALTGVDIHVRFDSLPRQPFIQ
jgi:hypothetical protein